MSHLDLLAKGDARGSGFYAEGKDHSKVDATLTTKVLIGAGAVVTGLEGVDVMARVRPSGSPTGATGTGAIIKTRTDSFARATGLFGYVRANSENTRRSRTSSTRRSAR